MSTNRRTRSRRVAATTAGPDRFFSDITELNACAANAQERARSLQAAAGKWANENIKRIERIDTAERCGWGMWRE
ncbi:MAG: hypothetical protein L0Y58_08425 [Verrucomicrobia subdivision 3 bacterium]|nr:hypothetical protein [Limisphaerales bacterium]